jgi:hypothetical protein
MLMALAGENLTGIWTARFGLASRDRRDALKAPLEAP